MILHIHRLEKSDQGLLGALLIEAAIFCITLEPSDTFIKPGNYHCVRFHGVKWPNTFEIIVPGHSAVLFHAGCVVADTKGCVLLGATAGKLRGDRAVLNSGETFRRFLEATAKQQWLSLFVSDNFY